MAARLDSQFSQMINEANISYFGTISDFLLSICARYLILQLSTGRSSGLSGLTGVFSPSDRLLQSKTASARSG